MSDSVALHSISSVAYVNPPLAKKVAPTDVVSFIPMADVSDSGKWIGRQTCTQAEISVGYTPFQDGDLLFAKITPCMENGKGCYVEGLCNGVGYGSTEFHVLRPKPGNDARFLYHWLQTEMARKKAEAFMIGSAGQQRVQTSFFDCYSVPVFPYDEQQRVAAILDAVDEVIAQTEALIAKLKQIKAGLLYDLLTRGFDENGQLRDPIAHPTQFKESTYGRIPRTWRLMSVGDAFEMQLGKMLSTVSKTGRNSYPYLANRNVQWDRVDLSSLEIMDFTAEEQTKFSLVSGDLLICEGGEVGRTALWRGEMETCFYQKAIHRLRPKSANISPKFFLLFMHRAVEIGWVLNYTSQTSIAHQPC